MRKYLSIMSTKTKLKCVGVIALAFLGSLLSSIWPVRLGDLYTRISNGEINSISGGAFMVIIFGLVYLSAECITILRRVIIDCIIATHESEVRESSTEKLLKMPMSFYSGSLSGEKTAQLNQGVAGFSQLIKIMCNDICTTVLTAVCTLVQVFLNASGIMVGIMSLYLVITIIISVFQIRSQNGIRESIVSQKTALDGQICQSISNLELIRGMNAEEYEKRRLLPNILGISKTEKKHHRFMGTFDCLKQICKISFQVILLVLSIAMIAAGNMSAGTVITVCLLFQQLVKPVDDVYRFMDETASSVIKAKALLEVTTSSSDPIYSIPTTSNNTHDNSLQVNDVLVMNPDGDSPIAYYDNISIPCDKVIALQGPNGCGKSTLIKCLTRIYAHLRGTISLFGKPQESYSQKDLTELIYYTPQSSYFIAGSVRDNLVYGLDRSVTDDELINALQQVHLVGTDHNDTVIRPNPHEALDFRLGERANELSGGMKQRLSLARAFLRFPRLYVFDEITANLDENATNYVLGNIEQHAKQIGAGIVYISHDPKVVARCNLVKKLNNKLCDESKGKIVA